MKNLLICLLLLTTCSTSLLSAYEEGTDFSTLTEINEDTAIISHDSLKIQSKNFVKQMYVENSGDSLKGKKISKTKKKVAPREICKRPTTKRKNMGNSGAMRNMYSANLSSLP